MTTIRDVARLAGVSTATVSATINNTAFVSLGLRERVEEAIERLGYSPDRRARSLKCGRTNLIGLVIADITNPYFTELARQAEAVARAAGYTVLLADTDQDRERDIDAVDLMRAHRVDGLLLAAAASNHDERLRRRLTMPTVLVDRRVEDCPLDFVGLDDRAAAEIATRHVIQHGHRRIGTVAGPQDLSSATGRLAGYRTALDAHGLPFDAASVVYCDFREAAAAEAARGLLRGPQRPTALFVANNLMLIGVMQALGDLGLRCPEDVSIICIDDFPWAAAFRPRLTVVRQPVRDIAIDAAGLLLERLAGTCERPPVEHLHAPELVVRDSVRAPSG